MVKKYSQTLSQALIEDSKRLIQQSKVLIRRSQQELAREQPKAEAEIHPRITANTGANSPAWILRSAGQSLQERVLAQQEQVEQQWERVALDQDIVLEQKRKMGLQ